MSAPSRPCADGANHRAHTYTERGIEWWCPGRGGGRLPFATTPWRKDEVAAAHVSVITDAYVKATGTRPGMRSQATKNWEFQSPDGGERIVYSGTYREARARLTPGTWILVPPR